MKVYDNVPDRDKLRKRLTKEKLLTHTFSVALVDQKRPQQWGETQYYQMKVVITEHPKADQPGYANFIGFYETERGRIHTLDLTGQNHEVIGPYEI